ncbi:hypothetical protein [Nakamurella sp.]|uniref:hypothetical protein n=1 Tax=Nakamurella sp. TaxID=1869182 RepID=UPI00378497EC
MAQEPADQLRGPRVGSFRIGDQSIGGLSIGSLSIVGLFGHGITIGRTADAALTSG